MKAMCKLATQNCKCQLWFTTPETS